jgi:RNA polymerase sigma-70 factor (ECF subfamily)
MTETSQFRDDAQLIAQCAQGNAKAQQHLYNRYAKRMYVTALRYSKTTFEAEDILQEAFIRIFKHIGEFKQQSSLDYWVNRIVINTALKQNRRILDKMHMEDVDEMHDEPVAEVVLSNYNFQELLAIIQQLPPGYQIVFNLYAIEGYKHNEIAEMLDISEGTSKSQYARAKAMLQKMIAKDESKIYERQR